MNQMKSVIITILVAIPLLESFPVTSKALENNSDQLIWQTAWYSHQLSQGKESPFTNERDGKKITAKSIFITPNFNQNTSLCPPGHKIDENGKCIKVFVVNINADDALVTRLQSIFSQHQTTDDSTSFDYDYSIDDEDSIEPTHYDLPLIPIINDNDTTTLYTVNESLVETTPRAVEEENQFTFRDPSYSDHHETSTGIDSTDHGNVDDDDVNTTPIYSDITKSNETEETSIENSTAWYQTPRVDENKVNIDQNDTTTVENATTPQEEQTETVSPASPDDDGESESNYTTELVINKSMEEDVTIRNGSDTTATHLDDYFEAIMANDSLLIDDTLSLANTTDVDYGIEVTTLEPETFSITTTEKSSPEVTSQADVFPYENRIIRDDEQNDDLENGEAANKFVYHHLSATESFSNVLPTPTPTIVRFPSDSDQRVRFPDEPRGSSFSWPRDNGGLMRFWRDQPLINDYKVFSSGGHSTTGGIGGYFHRRQTPYRRNF